MPGYREPDELLESGRQSLGAAGDHAVQGDRMLRNVDVDQTDRQQTGVVLGRRPAHVGRVEALRLADVHRYHRSVIQLCASFEGF